jgi:hypothetical protein
VASGNAGRWPASIAHGRSACVILKRVLGPQDANLAVALENLAHLLRQEGTESARKEA